MSSSFVELAAACRRGLLPGVIACVMMAGSAACWSEHVAPTSSVDARAVCANPSGAGPEVVVISNDRFAPSTITIPAGGQVIWVNCEATPGLAHTATSDTGVWDSGLLDPQTGFTHVYARAGTYPYHCTVHPFMTATVVVQ